MAQHFRIGTLVAAGVVALASPACVDIAATDQQYVQSEERRFQVTGVPDVSLTTFDGSIEVRTWDRPEVLVVAEKRGFDAEAVEAIRLEFAQQDNAISVKARYSGSRTVVLGFGRNQSVRMLVTVPVATKVSATTGDGRIDIRDVNGTLTADSGDGSITMQDVVGEVEAETGDGRIRLDGQLTRVRARSGDGSVAIHAFPGSEVRSDWNISSGDGSIVLEVPQDLHAELDASTGDGRVIARGLSVSESEIGWSEDREERRQRSRRTLRGPLNGGGPRIRLRTGDGSITLQGS